MHKILENDTEIAQTNSFAQAYLIASTMSKAYEYYTFKAVNGTIDRVITYKGGSVIHDSMND